MKHLTLASVLVALVAGCADDTTKPPVVGEIKPRETEWEVVVNALPFPLDGDTRVRSLTVGRKEFDENFANRGNIEVLYDHDDPTITIEVKKYVYGDEIDANGDMAAGMEGVFQRLSLWAYVNSGNPSPPPQMDPADDCTKDTWKDGCQVLVYYDGKAQAERSGADLRVRLPRGYRGQLFVNTEDNTTEQSYPRRGNITIDGLCSGGDIRLEAGWAKIKMCRDLVPTPTCPSADIQACENWGPMNMGEEAWSKDCPCGGGDFFGQLTIRAPQPWASNITVDIPSTVWLNTTLQNTSTMKPHECKPQIDCPQGICVLNTDDEYAPFAEFNYPSPAAPSGAGFNVTVESGGCTQIPFVDAPDQWPGDDGEPPSELRGNLKVCTDCL